MTEDDFVRLNVHLQEVMPIFDKFCIENNFTLVSRASLGRYPRVRIERLGSINLWFDLWMAYDQNGERFEHFRSDIPYDLGAGAYMDLTEDYANGVRFQKSFACFSNKPFYEIPTSLMDDLRKHLPELKQWNTSLLQASGTKVRIRLDSTM